MKRQILYGLCLITSVAYAVQQGPALADDDDDDRKRVKTYLRADLDPTAQDSGAPGTMWAGTGIPSTNFVLRRFEKSGIELAIKAHYRQGFDILPSHIGTDGLVHIEVPAGHQVVDPANGVPVERFDRARWNFSYSYNVAIEPGNPDLDAFRGLLLLDVDPSKKTDYLKFRLKKLTDTPAGQKSGYGWILRSGAGIMDDEGTPQVTQNSQNLAFYEAVIDADPSTPGQQSYAATDYGPGEFDVQLLLKGKKGPVARLHVVFDVVDP